MKYQVLLDEKGNVISAFAKGPMVAEGEKQPQVNSGPLLGRNQKLVEHDVPEEYIKKPIAEMLKLLQRDLQTKK
jgi:hypothetical protein